MRRQYQPHADATHGANGTLVRRVKHQPRIGPEVDIAMRVSGRELHPSREIVVAAVTRVLRRRHRG
jgi:hypothetical protein